MRRRVLLLVVAAAAQAVASSSSPEESESESESAWEPRWRAPCPERPRLLKSEHAGDSRRTVTFENTLDVELALSWVDFEGREVSQGSIMPLSDASRETFVGHVFRVRVASDDRTLVFETRVARPTREKLKVVGCGNVRENPRSKARDAEFESLVHSLQRPCEPSHDSSRWSCVRYLDASDLRRRDKRLYGIQPNETRAKPYATVDRSYTQQIGKIPQVSPGEGYLKMSFTRNLTTLLGEWYFERRKDSLKVHDTIPGGYTNNDVVKIDKIDLDRFPRVQQAVVREMREVLEWWTRGIKLKHTSTFGVRVYRRDSVLINHVDRMDTHLASAVVQIHQETTGPNQGWPLELYLSRGRVAEVYLQPHEIVLYEGAWLRHGRPMRYRGAEFANVFSHFAPPDWNGPAGGGAKDHYYGIPDDRLTTLADSPGITTSDFFEREQQRSESRRRRGGALSDDDDAEIIFEEEEEEDRASRLAVRAAPEEPASSFSSSSSSEL